MSQSPSPTEVLLLNDLRNIIEQGRQQLASTLNTALTLLYWQIGQRISTEILQGERAAERSRARLESRSEENN